MTTARFSFVYPTRHRPEFIRQALEILKLGGRDDAQVVICDNFVDPARGCESVCRESGLANLVYVRPTQPLGMIENWNHALQYATGEYVSFLTDKMFVLPDAVQRIGRAIDAAGGPEIVSWVSDAWHPETDQAYFGAGRYWSAPAQRSSETYEPYVPAEELNRRGRAEVSRTEATAADHARGKLAFGAYRRELVQRIEDRIGLFQNINPDYTSMVLGLSHARDAVELPVSCVVSVNTAISNGLLVDTNDAYALEFLDSLAGGARAILPRLPVPGLHASITNLVAHDYLSLRERLGLSFEFVLANWLAYISEDIQRPERRWSTPLAEAEQKEILRAYLASVEPALADAVRVRVAERAASRRMGAPRHVPFKRTWQRLTGTQPPPADTSADPVHFPATSIVAAVEEVVAARS